MRKVQRGINRDWTFRFFKLQNCQLETFLRFLPLGHGLAFFFEEDASFFWEDGTEWSFSL